MQNPVSYPVFVGRFSRHHNCKFLTNFLNHKSSKIPFRKSCFPKASSEDSNGRKARSDFRKILLAPKVEYNTCSANRIDRRLSLLSLFSKIEILTSRRKNRLRSNRECLEKDVWVKLSIFMVKKDSVHVIVMINISYFDFEKNIKN